MAAVSDSVKLYYKQSDGKQWAQFVDRKLNEKQYDIPAELREMSSMSHTISENDVSVALISPDMLTIEILEELNQCNSQFSLAVLLGVSDIELKNKAEKANAFMLFDWVTYELEATEDAVKVLLMTVIDLYEKVHGGEVEDEETPYNPIFQMLPLPLTDSSSDGSLYSKLPPARQVNAVHNVVPLNNDKVRILCFDFNLVIYM